MVKTIPYIVFYNNSIANALYFGLNSVSLSTLINQTLFKPDGDTTNPTYT